MIDEEIAADFGSWMNIDPGSTMRPLGHHSRYQRQLFPVKNMSDALYRDGFYAGVSDDYFVEAGARRISFIGRFDIASQQVADTGELPDQVEDDLFRPPAGALRLLQTQTLKGFYPKSLGDTQNPGRRNLGQLLGCYRLLIMESRKHKLEKVLTDLRDRPFGWQIGAVDVVNPTDLLVGVKDPCNELRHALFHGRNEMHVVSRAGTKMDQDWRLCQCGGLNKRSVSWFIILAAR